MGRVDLCMYEGRDAKMSTRLLGCTQVSDLNLLAWLLVQNLIRLVCLFKRQRYSGPVIAVNLQ